MSVNTIYGYKLWDSLLGVESVTWEFSTDINFNNVFLSDTSTGQSLIKMSPLLIELYAEVYCRVKINGYNGSTDWFLVEEDKSRNIYITKGYNKYSSDIYDNKVITKEIILDKSGVIIHKFDFIDVDDVIYLTQYEKHLDLDFITMLDINNKWFIDNSLTVGGNIYDTISYISDNDYLNLQIKNKNNKNYTTQLTYKDKIDRTINTYIECRLELMSTVNSVKEITFKDIDDNIIFKIDNISNVININGIMVADNIVDGVFYLIGVKGNGDIYLNHKKIMNINIPLKDIYSISMGQTYINDTVSPSNFKIDYIRVYENMLPGTIIAK